MRYYLALPAGWKADRAWPVLVVIPDAGREFEANLAAFVAVRGDRPYILVAPEVAVAGGGEGVSHGVGSRRSHGLGPGAAAPERWRGVAPVTTNYQRRGVDSTSISRAL